MTDMLSNTNEDNGCLSKSSPLAWGHFIMEARTIQPFESTTPTATKSAATTTMLCTLRIPCLSVIIPKDGVYFIHMHQQMDYEAGRLRHYLMHVGTFPRPLLTYPLGGRAGDLLDLALLGDARYETNSTADGSWRIRS